MIRWSKRILRLPTPALLALGTVLLLAPFLGKAVHIDDYLFIRAAQQILAHPLDPFGTAVNWYGVTMPLEDVTQNPPAVGYYLAVVAGVFGWSEGVLHAAFLLPAVAAVLGSYVLARRFCGHPAAAAVIVLVSPVFWLSATTLMSDIPMLALWVWALECWLRGLDTGRHRWLAAAAVLVVLAALTKYFAIALVPLLAAATVASERRVGAKLLWLLLPVAALGAYEMVTRQAYGHGLLAAAGEYGLSRHGELARRTVATLGFTGGCLLSAILCALRLCSLRQLALLGLATAAAVLLLVFYYPILPDHIGPVGSKHWLAGGQLGLFVAGGAMLLVLGIADLRAARNREALLLALWLAGTLFFTIAVNWTVNGRSILPLAPAAAFLVVRRLDAAGLLAGAGSLWRKVWPLLPAGLLAAVVVQADTHFAGTCRTAAAILHEHLGGRPGAVWFQGHWGFQYYMEAGGAKAVDFDAPALAPGDLLVTPPDNTNIRHVPSAYFVSAGSIEIPAFPLVSTMQMDAGAGFYSSGWGPLPFAVREPRVHRYTISRFQPPP